METKHTPGPWNVDYASHDDGGCSIRAIDRTLAWHVSQQDAFLIATAPEMLDLLVRLLNAGTWYGSALEIDRYEAKADGEELEAEIMALVAKATGSAA